MISRDVTPNMKPFGPCECPQEGCTLEGTLKKPFKDGTRHVRGCPCPRCRGRRSKSTGGKAQRSALKRAGMQRSSIATGHEEHALGGLRMEAKSGAQVRPLATAFDKAKEQSEASRAIGDNRPFVMAAVPEPEGKRMIYAFESRSTDELRTKVAAFAVQLGLL